MSRFFPHSDYAEDQPMAKTMLAAHVLYRGFQSGAVVGPPIAWLGSLLYRSTRSSAIRGSAFATLQRQMGIGAIVGAALMVPALPMRMWGREDIEWKDRSWRLLENEGQMEVDDWSLVGTAMGAVLAVRQTGGVNAVRILGGSAIGSLAGVVGYMAWRYGANGGERKK